MGWRPDIDLLVEGLPGVEWVEVIAEAVSPRAIPESLRVLLRRGVTVVPHGVGLGLGGAHRRGSSTPSAASSKPPRPPRRRFLPTVPTARRRSATTPGTGSPRTRPGCCPPSAPVRPRRRASSPTG
ncbi:DUF692 family multinuclear iron-containing protein [Streptomyces cinnamoneus]|uniref:multinuclear nonheme iron-dependent oxidase n=1 Tax=Streptomyces cinnamoneus TaxID=53446 RepID=UPI00378C372E